MFESITSLDSNSILWAAMAVWGIGFVLHLVNRHLDRRFKRNPKIKP